MQDPFGKALLEYFLKRENSSYQVIREDGLISEEPVEFYFRDYRDWPHYEREVLEEAKGRVLDIGAGAGRHSLWLQEKGMEVYAIDTSPLAVEVMKRRGLKNTYVMDVKNLNFPNNHFDTILMLYNNFGLGGNIQETIGILNKLHGISTPQAKILATIRDPTQTTEKRHLDYQFLNKKRERHPGQIMLRIEYKDETGDWFDLLMLPPNELARLVQEPMWNVEKIVSSNVGYYGTIIGKVQNHTGE